MSRPIDRSRRRLLQTVTAVTGAGLVGSLLPQLAFMPAARAAGPAFIGAKGGGYRAIVLLELGGGNDSWNLLVPRDGAGHAAYLGARGGVYDGVSNATGLGIAADALLPANPLDGGQYGIHPSCPALASMFGSGDLAFFANVGMLAAPISKAEYQAGSVVKPPQLFSHSDQTRLWHAATSEQQSAAGFGGRIAERAALGAGLVSPSISLAGSGLVVVGDDIVPYQMSTAGAIQIKEYFGCTGTNASSCNYQQARRAALESILGSARPHVLAEAQREISARAIDIAAVLGDELVGPNGQLSTIFPSGNSLADQLSMIARMIKLGRAGIVGGSHQVFYARLGGFDTHDNQMAATGQPLLFSRVNAAVSAFWAALGEIGARNDVVTVSLSEFARTLNSNGNGSDHGWGGVQFAFGGAVSGQRIYGAYPLLELDGPQSLSRGQQIPTLAVEQYAAPLADYMGLDAQAKFLIFPNLSRFDSPPLWLG